MDEWAGARHFPNHNLRILKARGMETGRGYAGINLPTAWPWRMAHTTIHNYLLVKGRDNQGKEAPLLISAADTASLQCGYSYGKP